MSKSKRAKELKRSKRPTGSIVLYVASIGVAIIGVAYLVTNILLFQKSVAQYVEQGYAVADVTSQLLYSQLLPGIYEPIAVYGGIALILFGAGMINHKLSKALKMLGKIEAEGTLLELDETETETETSKVETEEVKAAEIVTG